MISAALDLHSPHGQASLVLSLPPEQLIVHHDGHVDYVVNGRLMHPVQGGDEENPVTKFEDHGSIRALEDDFLTFYETLDVLSENADRAVESYCDLCDRGEV